jgi:hypothetical protein
MRYRLFVSSSRTRLLLAAVAWLFVAIARLHASSVPGVYTLDLPVAANAATPSWLGHPETPATTFATLSLPIQPPDATSSLLVTIFFQEKPEGFLRLTWNGTQGAQSLSDNFYEGIGMSNQRSLLIAPGTLQNGGTLILQCGDAVLGVQRIRLQWLENRDGLVSPELQDTLVTPALGATQSAEALNGQPAPAESPIWQGTLVNVPLTDTAQRIEEGVEFSVSLDSVPRAGRLILKENGMSWAGNLVVWINQQRAGTITPAVPELNDGGFPAIASSTGIYVGWREGSIFLPPAMLKAGINTVQFSVEDPSASGAGNSTAGMPPLAVKNVVLQLASAPATSVAPTSPAPATTASTPPPTSVASMPSPAATLPGPSTALASQTASGGALGPIDPTSLVANHLP